MLQAVNVGCFVVLFFAAVPEQRCLSRQYINPNSFFTISHIFVACRAWQSQHFLVRNELFSPQLGFWKKYWILISVSKAISKLNDEICRRFAKKSEIWVEITVALQVQIYLFYRLRFYSKTVVIKQ